MAEVRTLKLDFVVKKWQNLKRLFGILIYTLCRFQNDKNPVGHIDTSVKSAVLDHQEVIRKHARIYYGGRISSPARLMRLL